MDSYYADKKKHESADAAIVLYEEYLETDLTDADAWFALGSLLADRGRLQRAIEALRTAIRVARKPRVDYLVNLGLALQQAADWSEAAKVYEAALRLAPEDTQVLTNLAIVLLRSDSDDRSLELFRRVVKLDPSTPSRANLATELLRRQAWNDAETVLREGLLSEPDAPLLLVGLGEVLLMKDRFDEALGYAKQAHAQAPDERSTVLVANLLSLVGRNSEARDLLQAWIAREPGRWFPRGLLGAVCVQLGDGTAALEAFRAASAVGPVENSVDDLGRSGSYWRDWLHAGFAAGLALSGQTEQARSAFEEVRRLHTNAAEDFPEFFAYDRRGDDLSG